MATVTDKASDLLSRPRHLGQYGEANVQKFVVAMTQGGLADTLRFGIIPAGTEVQAIILANEDCDTGGTSGAFKLGYSPVDGTNPAASLDAFVAAGDTTLTGAQAGKVYNNFAPVKFEYDVFLDLTLTVAMTTPVANAKVWITVLSRNVGVK